MCDTVAVRLFPGLSTSSFTPLTVTVCGVFQVPVLPPVKLSDVGLTVAVVVAELVGVTVTVVPSPGSVSSTTV